MKLTLKQKRLLKNWVSGGELIKFFDGDKFKANQFMCDTLRFDLTIISKQHTITLK
jgi:hypothetical protein